MTNLADLPEEIKDYIKSLEKQNSTWEVRYSALEERYQLLLYKRFCRAAETVDKNQGLLFDIENLDGESLPDVEPEEREQIKSYDRKKPGRKPIDESLPRKDIIIDIPESEKQCACGETLVRIGEEVSERLQVIPARMWVERIIRPKYACRKCEGSGDEDKSAVRTASAPATLIPGSITTPGLLAFIMLNKYADHLPFYRQEKSFERIGIHISRQNMSNWQQQVYSKLLPLFALMKNNLRSGPVIQMDETPVQVMNETDRENTQKSYMWLARGGPPGKPVVLYEYRETRASTHIHSFLEGFTGFLQTDGYEGYACALKTHPAITHVGCFAHARRKFFEAAKVSKKAVTAEAGIKFIKSLYRIETELRAGNMDDTAFVEKRKELCAPVLAAFRKWLEEQSLIVLPSSLTGNAIGYALKQWSHLTAYLESPFLTPDNNASENAIRPFVIGRKNWLFCGSPDGASSSCGMYSLIETAKQNNLNPHDYLSFLFEKAPFAKNEKDWTSLLPWNCASKFTH